MLDIKLLRKQPEWAEKKLHSKNPEVSLLPLLAQDEEIRQLKTRVEELQSERNTLSKSIGEQKRKGLPTGELFAKVSSLGDEATQLNHQLKEKEKMLEGALALLPNIPMDDIPVSPDPKDNVPIKTKGEKPSFPFPFKNHVELNEKLHLFDFKKGAKMTGSGWPLYTDRGARLEWALIQYMLSVQIKNGFQMIIPPLLVRPEAMYGSGQLPKFSQQLFRLTDPDYDLFLIPTSEVALNAMHLDEILDESNLPMKYCAFSPCFRREAGAAGKQERGLIRMHQFHKVEMFAFTKPQQSPEMFESMLESASEILDELGLHYRHMLLVTGDMSFAAGKTVDIEVWLPGQDRYYEVSSVSNCTDFQARRSQIRYRDKKEDRLEWVHTLNGSGLATSRLLVALLENNQQPDGSVTLPDALHPYLGGMEILTPV